MSEEIFCKNCVFWHSQPNSSDGECHERFFCGGRLNNEAIYLVLDGNKSCGRGKPKEAPPLPPPTGLNALGKKVR